MNKQFKLKPFGNRVILRKEVIEQTSKGGIIIAEAVIENSSEYITGRVVAVGDGVRQVEGVIPTESKVGQLVLYNPRQGINFSFEGEEYIMIRDSEISSGVVE